MNTPAPSISYTELEKVIRDQLGLDFSGSRQKDLERHIKLISQKYHFTNLTTCIEWLLERPLESSRIEILAQHLTIGETYFFRDKKCFELLENKIFPEIVFNNHLNSPQLRIWSAGCSTGEEPYSIAISLSNFIPNITKWQLTILATDINLDSLNRLGKGLYKEWSFRNVPSVIKEKYFDKDTENNYWIKPVYKNMVTANYLNLITDTYPSMDNNTNAMDIIICRNVLMYFTPEQAEHVIKKFMNCLKVGGWLIVSPCEIGQSYFKEPQLINIASESAYKKIDQAFMNKEKKIESLEICKKVKLKTKKYHIEKPISNLAKECLLTQDIYKIALDNYAKGMYQQVIRDLEYSGRQEWKVHELLARAYANVGDLKSAKKYCEKAISMEKTSVRLYYLNAIILEELGYYDEALTAFKKTLYLDHGFVLAHYNLAQITSQLGRKKEADKYFSNAKLLASHLKPDEIIPESEGLTASRLLDAIEVSQRQLQQR